MTRTGSRVAGSGAGQKQQDWQINLEGWIFNPNNFQQFSDQCEGDWIRERFVLSHLGNNMINILNPFIHVFKIILFISHFANPVGAGFFPLCFTLIHIGWVSFSLLEVCSVVFVLDISRGLVL